MTKTDALHDDGNALGYLQLTQRALEGGYRGDEHKVGFPDPSAVETGERRSKTPPEAPHSGARDDDLRAWFEQRVHRILPRRDTARYDADV